jgi:hypothetical protein
MHLVDVGDRAEIEFAVKVREQLAVARRLEAQRSAQRIGIDRDQEQAGLAGEVLSGRLGDLLWEREVDETVARIVSAAPVYALPLGLAPSRSGTNFVDPAHLSEIPACCLSFFNFLPELPDRATTVSAHPAYFKSPLSPACPAPETGLPR